MIHLQAVLLGLMVALGFGFGSNAVHVERIPGEGFGRRAESGSGTRVLPVLLLSDGCRCTAGVDAFHVGVTLDTCADEFGNAQLCVEKDLTSGSLGHGNCYVPPPPPPEGEEPGPPVCPNPVGPCTFSNFKLKVAMADCADGACGVGPWQAYNQLGVPVGSPIAAGGSYSIDLTLGDLHCASAPINEYVEVRSTGNVQSRIFKFRVRTSCSQCPSGL
jgi:hypothetical protein